MDKQKQQIIIVGVLVAALIGVLVNNLRPRKRPPRPQSAPEAAGISLPRPEPAAEREVPLIMVRASADEIKQQQERGQLDWGLDPFYHRVSKDVYHGSSLLLKGISIDRAQGGYAIINNEIVTSGDIVFGYRVEEIQRNKVLLKRGMESFYLVLPEE